MKYRLIVLLLVFFHQAYANVAVDELNALLAKKEKGVVASAQTKGQTEMIKNIREN